MDYCKILLYKMRKTALILFFFSIQLISYCQVISGTVFDKTTKDPIFSASVYFNGTSVGVLTDEKGNFRIDISKYPSMPLTISAIGYYSVTQNDVLKNKTIQVFMNPKLVELAEVVVKDNSKWWKRSEDLTIFRNEFLGTTSNSMNCVITNEKDIRFKHSPDNDTLRAFAVKPIIIRNKALGYKITYFLDKFEFDTESKTFLFKGNVLFQEDSTIIGNKKAYFEKKRKDVYIGSRMQFFRALWIDDLNAVGYTVRNTANEVLNYKKIVVQQNDHTKYLRYHGDLGIAYNSKQSTSFIIFLKENVYFDANGYYEPDGITWEGDMTKQRIADTLPFSYSVDE
jgi:hypothetical protein